MASTSSGRPHLAMFGIWMGKNQGPWTASFLILSLSSFLDVSLTCLLQRQGRVPRSLNTSRLREITKLPSPHLNLLISSLSLCYFCC